MLSAGGVGLWDLQKYFHYGKWTFNKGEFRINDSLLEGRPMEVVDALFGSDFEGVDLVSLCLSDLMINCRFFMNTASNL